MFPFLLLLLFMASPLLAAPSPVKIDDGDTVTGKTDVTVTTSPTLIAASNSSRASLSCTTTQAVRWGHSTVSSTKGQSVPAGGSVEIHNTAAIYMAAEASDANVSCTEETYSASSGTGVFSP